MLGKPRTKALRRGRRGLSARYPSAIRHGEKKSSKTHEDPDMKPTKEMLTPTAKQDHHPTTLETDNAQAGRVIGRASPRDSAGTQIISRRAGRAGRRSRLPHRASAGEPPPTHGGARRPEPGGGRLSPETVCRGWHPGGRARPRGPAGGQDEHFEDPRGRNVGPRGRGATENGQARSSGAMRRPRPVSNDRAAMEGRPIKSLCPSTSRSPPLTDPRPGWLPPSRQTTSHVASLPACP